MQEVTTMPSKLMTTREVEEQMLTPQKTNTKTQFFISQLGKGNWIYSEGASKPQCKNWSYKQRKSNSFVFISFGKSMGCLFWINKVWCWYLFVWRGLKNFRASVSCRALRCPKKSFSTRIRKINELNDRASLYYLIN